MCQLALTAAIIATFMFVHPVKMWVFSFSYEFFYPTSRILIFIHPGYRNSDPGSNKSNKSEGEKNFVLSFFVLKYQKIEAYFIFELVNKENMSHFNLLSFMVLFTQNIVTKFSKIWVWNPGVKKSPDLKSGSATLLGTVWGGTASSHVDTVRVAGPDPYWIRIQSGQLIRIQGGKNDLQK